MTSARLIIQTIILTCLFAVGVYLIFCTPEDTDPAWLRTLLISKAAGAASVYGYYRLYCRWMKEEKH